MVGPVTIASVRPNNGWYLPQEGTGHSSCPTFRLAQQLAQRYFELAILRVATNGLADGAWACHFPAYR